MIYISRTAFEIPKLFSSSRIVKMNDEMIRYFTQNKKSKKQSSYRFDNYLAHNKMLRKELANVFSDKCAYCESRTSHMSVPAIDHFRPKQHAMNLDGSVDQEHYWWLAYKWENLYYSCQICNLRKRSRFPVLGKRINRVDSTEIEEALLIDPCKLSDFNEVHFQVLEDGVLTPITKKGEVTIEVLNLNMSERCKARAKIILNIKDVFTSMKSIQYSQESSSINLLNLLEEYLSKESEYLSTAIAAFIYYSNDFKDSLEEFKIIIDKIHEDIDKYVTSIRMGNVESQYVPKSYEEKTSYSIESQSLKEKEAYFTSVKRIQKIEVKNFKIIKNLTLEFPRAHSDEEAWLTLLGENGSGKSSLLQAIALTLVGDKHANSLGLDASEFVNKNTRLKQGYVRIYLKDEYNYLELRFSNKSKLFEFNYNESKVILLAFGSTRLMSNNSEKDFNNNLRNLRNLFDPFAPLPNVEQWISNPKEVSTRRFDQIAIELKKVLQLQEDRLIYRRKVDDNNYQLFIKLNNDKEGTKISDLSAGYKTVIVMTLNIIREVLKTWNSFKIAEGIVLIDEIGVHLHPKWKMQIVSTLREIFPMINFIITTHEPLCLRGINKGEVALMKFNEKNEVIALTDLPSPKSLTVEQLITSKFFGLITSFDPEVEQQLNSYYLLQSKIFLGEEEKNQLEVLKQELEDLNMMSSGLVAENNNIDLSNLENNTLDSRWVSNPMHQDKLEERIKEIWTKKKY